MDACAQLILFFIHFVDYVEKCWYTFN